MMNVTAFLTDRKVSKPKRWENAKRKRHNHKVQGQDTNTGYRNRTQNWYYNFILHTGWTEKLNYLSYLVLVAIFNKLSV